MSVLRNLPVTHVAGVGRVKEANLTELKLYTVFDLLHHFPYRYEDCRIQSLHMFQPGAKVTVLATVQGMATVKHQGRKSILTAQLLVDQQTRVTGIWFNQPYLKQKLSDGRLVVISGKWETDRNMIVVSHTEFELYDARHPRHQFTPVYRSVKGLSSAQLRQLIEQACTQFADQLDEVLPNVLTEKYRLVSHRQAVQALHAPDGNEALRQAHRRLAFEEFFLFQLQLQWFRRAQPGQTRGLSRAIPADAFELFCASLPFSLTNAQIAACGEISQDLQTDVVMNRLLQGDVGSGKTWVALWATYATSRAGYQTAFMVPTEILAEQHFREATKRLAELGLCVALLTGSTPEKARNDVLNALAIGKIDLVVGTHALLTEGVKFQKLGLVITDEQHRFGVSQRAMLRAKGQSADVLFLSATPIPRTLAIAIYGDLDISALRELPKGRKPIHTEWLRMSQVDAAIRKVRQELAVGRQTYVVAPLVEQSEVLDLTSATELYSHLCDVFAGSSVGLLHGKMSSREKDKIMHAFIAKKLDVLVSTTVIEVGIDVPNATVMMIYHAERFGLSQLHQLRGRVGRGSETSYCILLSDPTNEVAKRRLQTMISTVDGFEIAERDLELRGPGEFFGVRQSGLPEFSVGDLTRDFKVMEVARNDAIALIQSLDFWLQPCYEPLRQRINTNLRDSSFTD